VKERFHEKTSHVDYLAFGMANDGATSASSGDSRFHRTRRHTTPNAVPATHELGEEMVASYLYQVHPYHWLEANDYGRFLVDSDL
jgi:hypothetical protein